MGYLNRMYRLRVMEMPTLRRLTSCKLMSFANENIIVNVFKIGYLNNQIRSSRLREMEMPTLRRLTSGKLMCFANETIIFLTLIKWVGYL